ncbi:M3 family metallopeptidase [Rhodocytophaga rosea]|uniref:M3 family metallopeptidase n=1 Tax=Rhodocytophaga rosea TaxID=2704465 RepID=A0A6C0GJZ0_9BACT|nr:M3 family metallopeptidase [Rhodocytophaga rosea]QHT68356.1 M3 family metallopeptidase [Rhodocytophaga rosea]
MNPLLNTFDTPFETIPFTQIRNEHYLPAIQSAIQEAKSEVELIKNNPAAPDFANTIEALEHTGRRVSIVSGVLFNLNVAETSPELMQLAREISPLLSAYSNDIMLDEVLFARIEQVYSQKESLHLDTEEAMLLDKTYKGFVRNGAGLNAADKARLREIDEQLSRLSLQFSEHVLNEINAYILEITDAKDLAGLPESAIALAAQAAREKGKENTWIFTLQLPSYIPFMTYADNRSLREQLFRAYASRNFMGGENDNQEIILQLVKLRHERANILGFETYAQYVLQERMAESPVQVEDFLKNLLSHAKPAALRELQELSDYAARLGGPQPLERWDFAYYSEKLKKEKFSIDNELLKPYFQLEDVLEGVFKVSGKLYGLLYKENPEIPVYHPDVKVYEVSNLDGGYVGLLYTDFFPRAGKKSGAWMTSYKGQFRENGINHRPHISIVCNFTKSTSEQPSLLTFNEVTTLFHEFGHALHGLLADSTYESLSGTHVYWDFVELPSQIMENWVYEKECLDLFARHYKTGEKIPEQYIQKIKESANFLAGYNAVRQVGLAQLDMAWHTTIPNSIISVGNFEQAVLQSTQVLPPVENSNTSCSFNHIFGGGYASGYYSYKWAEVLDADAFEFFLEKGIFDAQTASLFRKYILSAGGSEHPMELYKKFRGKIPSPDALLRRAGLLQIS